MFKQLQKNENLLKILLVLLIIAVGTYVLNLIWQIVGRFSDLIMIFIFSWLLSFILEPSVDRIKNVLKIEKVWATLITYLLLTIGIVAFILLFVPTVTVQIQTLIQVIPGYLESAPKLVNNWGDVITAQLMNSITVLPSVAQFLFSVFIVLIFSFYFNVDSERATESIYKFAPKSWHTWMRFLQKVINDAFSSFLRLQLFYGIFTWVTTWIVLVIFGTGFAASSSFLAGILGLIPLIGAPLSIIPAVFVALLTDPSKAVAIGIILLILQQILYNIIGPRFLSGAFKIHPAVIMISFLVGMNVAGSIGALFAIPVMGIIAVLVRELNHYLTTEKKQII